MKLPLPVKAPFSFPQTLAFLRRFPPCSRDYVITDDSLTAAVTVNGRAATFTIRDGDPPTVEVDRAVDAPALLARACDLIGARDDIAPFYAAAKTDAAFQPIVDMLYGLHHVRFLTLEEIAIYSVMMQRQSIQRAAGLKRTFFEKFGTPVHVGDATLYALPSFDALVQLDGATIAKAINHSTKGEQIANVIRGVAKIGEKFLREAPYEAARDELVEVKGIGPFSAAAILLRGLGRMPPAGCQDGLTAFVFEDAARELYGKAYDEAELRTRYGKHLGYWTFYLKTGVPRLAERAAKRKLTSRA